MRSDASAVCPAGAALSSDPDPRRAGLLAVAEAATGPGKRRTRSVFVFASGAHAHRAGEVAAGASEHVPDATVVVIGGAGVISNEGESEGEPAVTALALTAPMTAVVGGAVDDELAAREQGRSFAGTLTGPKRRPVLLFTRPTSLASSLVDAFHEASGFTSIVGGGLTAEAGIFVTQPGEEPVAGDTAVLRVDGGMRLAIGRSPGVKLLGDYATVDEMEGGFVLSLGGRKPLEVLTELVASRKDRPLVLAAVAPREEPDARASALVRGISGVKPQRGAIHVGTEVVPGDRISFATLDPTSARSDMVAMLRELERDLCGGVPVAGLFIDCAGRGPRLYGRGGVDAAAIRSRFEGVPFAGMRSSFEIAPFDGRPRIHAYSGVLALLYAPS